MKLTNHLLLAVVYSAPIHSFACMTVGSLPTLNTASVTLSQDETKTVYLNDLDVTLEVIIPGKVSDGWVSSADETGFTLVDIKEAAIAGKAAVKLIFTTNSTPKASTMVLRQGRGFFRSFFRKKWELKIKEVPRPLC